jgi:rhamnulokinase
MNREDFTVDRAEALLSPRDRRALVAIDLGAESCRVSLLRWEGDRHSIHLVHRFPNDAIARPDGLRWDIHRILSELERGLADCATIATEGIRSIAVDGWAVDYIRLDAHGIAVADPFCYRDERTLASESLLHRRLSAESMRDITGIQLLRINTAYQMYADGDDLRVLRWLNLPEYILYRLGGHPVSEMTNASHTQLLGLDGEWSREVFAAVDAPIHTAPTLVLPGTDLGPLTGRLAELPAFADTRLIAPACHDTASAIASISDTSDEWAYISSGTWSLVGTVLNSPINTQQARSENFTNLRGVDGTICFHKNVNGMWLLRQCLKAWNEDVALANPEPLTISRLVEAATAVAPRDYTLDVDDPDLLLPGRMPERINTQLRRRGLRELNPTREHAAELASFLFHSLAARYTEVLQSVATITGKHLQRLYVMGGGSQNQLLNRLTAEATGLQVICVGAECSTVGNFAVQLGALEGRGDITDRRTSVWAIRLNRQ